MLLIRILASTVELVRSLAQPVLSLQNKKSLAMQGRETKRDPPGRVGAPSF